ncbi:MAG: hypothetical protein ACQEP5_05650 [Actinomycetota bacterium]
MENHQPYLRKRRKAAEVHAGRKEPAKERQQKFVGELLGKSKENTDGIKKVI